MPPRVCAAAAKFRVSRSRVNFTTIYFRTQTCIAHPTQGDVPLNMTCASKLKLARCNTGLWRSIGSIRILASSCLLRD